MANDMIIKKFTRCLLLEFELEFTAAIKKMGLFALTTKLTISAISHNANSVDFFAEVLYVGLAINQTLKRFDN
jgi:hypothetical protein